MYVFPNLCTKRNVVEVVVSAHIAGPLWKSVLSVVLIDNIVLASPVRFASATPEVGEVLRQDFK